MLLKHIFRHLLCFLCALTLQAQMKPSAPVQNFRFPRFGDNGYTQWVLQGGQGIYDSEEQIRIKDMALRVYSGDERMAVEMTLDSPEATLRIKENRAYSDAPIEIVGPDFKISGVGWTWDGASKEIQVNFDVVVEFTQAIADALLESPSGTDEVKKTEILSERLRLKTTEEEYQFEFTNRVHVNSGEMKLKSDFLIAFADAPEGKKAGVPVVEAGQLDSMRKIIARDGVVIEQGGRIVRAEEAEFFPREQRVNLSGSPQVETAGAYLSGETIQSRKGEIIITGGTPAGRAQMILTRTGGLGIQGASALGSETIVLADRITMRELESENHFNFDGAVEVMSGTLHLNSETMTILAEKQIQAPAKSPETQPEGETLKVGKVRSLVAEGTVRIEREGQVATSDKVVFYPEEERAVLTGNPKVENEEAVVTGERMQLEPGRAKVDGSEAVPVVVRLPPMPDLGYEASEVVDAETPQEGPVVEPAETVVRSRMLDMVETKNETTFRFTDNVEVTATNLQASCKRMEVIAREQEESAEKQEDSRRYQVERVDAFENVKILQDVRTATADKATILPVDGQVILEGNAAVEDDRGRASGYRLTLNQGQRRAVVEGGGPTGERARIILPETSTSGF